MLRASKKQVQIFCVEAKEIQFAQHFHRII